MQVLAEDAFIVECVDPAGMTKWHAEWSRRTSSRFGRYKGDTRAFALASSVQAALPPMERCRESPIELRGPSLARVALGKSRVLANSLTNMDLPPVSNCRRKAVRMPENSTPAITKR